MSQNEKGEIDNFKSTADLCSNPGFQSSLSVASKDVINDKPYNPFENRQVEHPTSTIGAVVHLLKACLGTGVLAMPSGFKNAGLAAGVIGTILAGFFCTNTVQMVVETSQRVCVDAKKPSMSFAETCGAAFAYGPKRAKPWANFVRTLIDYSLAVTYLSVLCVYVVFIGSSVKEVLDFYYPEMILSIQTYCVLTLVPLVLICQIRNLKFLVPISLLANILIVVVFCITLYYVFTDLPPVSEREMVASISQWPLFLSPQKFLGCPGVWNVAMIIVISLYGVVGFFGYLQFGNDAKGSITLNLPEDDMIAQGTKLLMALVIYFSYALQFYVPMEFINRLLNKRSSKKYENVIQLALPLRFQT
ncbi:unnamed protein product [Leptidea sinapis]|uniref:Amino acid transporter transmembrane domain-containing protein n=1 Tax=Leptidea sinapis TaxID=189913 RepID=A0A5E4PPE4_9NEOP|nr:unnamed protein product [Leptidea sinapis]